ncbi:MAG: hypothetical protein RLZZ200_1249 [Pseudomonadota bacterium]
MKWDGLLRWYATRDPRDQRILKLGALVVPALAVLVGLTFLHRSGAALAQRVATKQQDLAWIRAVLPTVAAAGPGSVEETDESLVEVIDRTINESGLSKVVTGALPAGEDVLKVTFENAPFNNLLAWIKRLAEQQGLRIKSATIDATTEAGMVNASFDVSDES